MTQPWKLKLVSVLISLAIGIGLAEIGLRIVGFSSPNFVMPDEYRGFSLRPNAEGWWRKEGEAYIRINSDGLRDRERIKKKPPNTFRIAMLGDSMIEALQVPLEETACAIIENRLQGCEGLDDLRIEVINFGVSGYGTVQQLFTLRHKVWDYSPDIVVLAFTTINDIRDNVRTLAHHSDLRPYFVYHNGQLVPDKSFLQSPRFRQQRSSFRESLIWLKSHFRILELLNDWRSALGVFRLGRDQDFIDTSNLVYREPNDPIWSEAWRITEAMILLMRDEVRTRNAKFLLATLTNDYQVHPDSKVRQEFATKISVKDLSYPDQRLRALGEREGFPVVNLTSSFADYAENNRVFLHGFDGQIGFGHWNAEGNRLAAEILSEELCGMIVPSPS